MPRPSTPRVSGSHSISPSPQPTSSTRAPGSTMSATTSKSTREPPGVRAAPAMVRSYLRRFSISPRRQAARLRGAFEEAADDAEQFRLVEQECVMALVGRDLGERDAGAGGIERMNDGAGFRGREQPVAGERDHAKPRRRAAKRVRRHAIAVGGEIEIVHRARQIEIGIGVKALDESDALVPQIGLDLKIGVEGKGR